MVIVETQISTLPDGTETGRTSLLGLALALFAATLALYALTANRGPQWQDGGFHIYRIVAGEPVHPLGLALSHPLHYWIGRLAITPGLAEPSFAITLISSIAAAAAVACVFGCVTTLTNNRRAALFAALSLTLAHTFWQMATRTEAYTLAAALLAGECWCLAAYAVHRRPAHLCGAFLLNGLGVANHLLALLTLPVLVVVLVFLLAKQRIRIGHVLATAAFWLLGAAPYWGLVIQQCVRTGEVGEVLHSAFFGRSFADEVLNVRLPGRMLAVNGLFVAMNFPNLLLPLAAVGCASVRRPSFSPLAVRALLAGLLIHGLFAMRYSVADQYTFFLPLYVLLVIFGGVGFARMDRPADAKGRVANAGLLRAGFFFLLLTPALYGILPSIARRWGVLESVARQKPYRDDYTYLFSPWGRADDSALRMARHALELAGHDGLIVLEELQSEGALRYTVLREVPSGVQVVIDPEPEQMLEAWNAGRRVVLVPAHRDRPDIAPPTESWRRDGDLYFLHYDQAP